MEARLFDPEALAESETEYRAVYVHSPKPVTMVNVVHGRTYSQTPKAIQQRRDYTKRRRREMKIVPRVYWDPGAA